MPGWRLKLGVFSISHGNHHAPVPVPAPLPPPPPIVTQTRVAVTARTVLRPEQETIAGPNPETCVHEFIASSVTAASSVIAGVITIQARSCRLCGLQQI